jgi:hypothetical protein
MGGGAGYNALGGFTFIGATFFGTGPREVAVMAVAVQVRSLLFTK